jgi:putative transposase
MRQPRLKFTLESAYHHAMNRIAGPKDVYPFDDIDKEYFVQLIQELSRFFTLDILSYCIMGNHYHILLHAPIDMTDPIETAERHNAFYKKCPHKIELKPDHTRRIETEALRMRDISEFIKILQQRFTCWFNKRHNRRGALWQGRFKNTILEGGQDLICCYKYVELNPVRAKLVYNPEDYRHSSWGSWHGTGRPPFECILKYMQLSYGEFDLTMDALENEIRIDMLNSMAAERGYDFDDLQIAHNEAWAKTPASPTKHLTLLRSVTLLTLLRCYAIRVDTILLPKPPALPFRLINQFAHDIYSFQVAVSSLT